MFKRNKWKILGCYNYKGNDQIIFYRIRNNGLISIKHKKITAKNTDTHFFNGYKLFIDLKEI